MTEPGPLFGMGAAGLLDVLQSVRFHAQRLADDHPSDWDLTRAVDALAEQVDALVATVTADPERAGASLSFRVAETGPHRMSVASRGRDVVVLVDDSGEEATRRKMTPPDGQSFLGGLVGPLQRWTVVRFGERSDQMTLRTPCCFQDQPVCVECFDAGATEVCCWGCKERYDVVFKGVLPHEAAAGWTPQS